MSSTKFDSNKGERLRREFISDLAFSLSCLWLLMWILGVIFIVPILEQSPKWKKLISPWLCNPITHLVIFVVWLVLVFISIRFSDERYFLKIVVVEKTRVVGPYEGDSDDP